MRSSLVAVVLVGTLVVSGSSAVVADNAPARSISSTDSAISTPVANVSIVAIYPNPVADEDAGEYVVLSTPSNTDLAGFTLADDHATVDLPNATVSGRVALSSDPQRAANRTDVRVLGLDGSLPLANSGENLTLRAGTRTIDTLSYADAPEGEVGRVKNDSLGWEPLGGTDFAIRHGDGGSVETFVLPDAGGRPVEILSRAEERILLGGYTFGSQEVTEALLAASDRGVNVRVLLEGGPVGGMTRREATLLDRLVAGGVEVAVVGGEAPRVDHHHAKYAVVDDRAMVLTENWKPAGTGGDSSRGWGVVVSESAIVNGLLETFRADAGWRDAIPWETFRDGESFSEGSSSAGEYATRYTPTRYHATNTSLFVAPDNAERAVIDRLENASRSIDVIQVGVGGVNQSFVRALKRAADRGVEVRLLLSRAWYTAEENRQIATRLERWAEREDAALSVRLARPRDRFEKIHAKGAVVDGETVVVGSLNWNDHSARQNREVVLAVEGAGPAGYFADVFADDWRAAVWRLSVGLCLAVLAVALGAVAVGRRIEFEGGAGRLLQEDLGDNPRHEY